MNSHRIDKQICIVSAPATMTLNDPPRLKEYLLPLVEDPEINGFIINCKSLYSIDSYGIGSIVSLFKAVREKGRKFALTNLSERQMSIFEATRLVDVINIFASEKEALEQMRE